MVDKVFKFKSVLKDIRYVVRVNIKIMSLNVMQVTLGYHPQEGPQTPERSFKKIPHLISTPSIYIRFQMKKIQNMLVWLNKMVLPHHLCTCCWGLQKVQKQSVTPTTLTVASFMSFSHVSFSLVSCIARNCDDFSPFFFFPSHSL